MLDIDKPRILYPTLKVLAWRTVTTHLVAGLVKNLTKSEHVIAWLGAVVLTVGMGIEVLEFDPAPRHRLAVNSVN